MKTFARIASLSVALAVASFAAPAFAVFAPVGAPTIVAGKPDTRTPESIKAKNGTAYTISAFCPKGAAAGTCTGESLSELSGGNQLIPGTPGSCTQDGVEVTVFPFSIKGASKKC